MVEIPAYYRTRELGNSKSSFLKMLFSYTKALLRLRLETNRFGKVDREREKEFHTSK